MEKQEKIDFARHLLEDPSSEYFTDALISRALDLTEIFHIKSAVVLPKSVLGEYRRIDTGDDVAELSAEAFENMRAYRNRSPIQLKNHTEKNS